MVNSFTSSLKSKADQHDPSLQCQW